MTETLLFMALGLGVVLVAGIGIVGSRSRGRRMRRSDNCDPGMSHMWFADSGGSDSSGSDCSPGDAGGADCGGGGGDGGSD